MAFPIGLTKGQNQNFACYAGCSSKNSGCPSISQRCYREAQNLQKFDFLKTKEPLMGTLQIYSYHLSMIRSWFFFFFFTKIHLKKTYFHWLRVHNRNIVLNKLISVASSAMIQSVGPPLFIGLSTGTTPLSTAVHHCLEPQHLKISSEYSLSQCISQKFSLRYHGPF